MVAAVFVEQAFAQLGAPAPEGIARVGGGLAAAALVSAGLRGRERVDAERLGQDYTHQVRLVLFERLSAMAPRAVQQRSQGGTALRFVGDLNSLRRWISLGLARLIVAGTTIVGALIALLFFSGPLAGVIAAVVAVAAAVALSRSKPLREATRAARRRRARLAGNVTERIATVGVMQVFGAVDRERERVDRQSDKLRGAMVDRAVQAGGLLAVTEGAAAAATAAVVLTGLASGIAAPEVAAAMAITGLLVPQLRDLGRVQEYHQGARVAQEAIARFLDRPTLLTEPAASEPLRRGPGRLAFEDVRLDDVLHGVTATAEPGTVVALVGPNGAGKSTLLALAARLLDVDGGRVLLDGQDLARHQGVQVRRLVGMAGPDLPLVRGTVEHNLRYRRPDAPVEELAKVAWVCGLDEILDTLPKRERTRLTEGGRNLSAGQRQRLLLARALLGDPAVLLLDEAEANLDHEAGAAVDRVLAGHRGTVLLVTHDLDRVRAADVVWHVDGGRLVETGAPAALLRGTGPTARLFGTGLEVVG